MVRRRDRNRIDARIVEQPADIDERSGAALDLSAAFLEQALVDITERRNLDVRDARKRVEVILPATPETADGDAHAVVGAEHALRTSQEREAGENARGPRRLRRRLEEVPPSPA